MSTLNMVIAISISEPEPSDLAARGLAREHVRHAYVELARQVLAAGGGLAYGGRPAMSGMNFVDILIALLRTYSNPDRPPPERIQLFLAAQNWRELTVGDRARLRTFATLYEVDPADDDSIALNLTAMRQAMTAASDARVLLGGRTTDYQGRWPGIIEEAYLTLTAARPLYIAGGLGGAAAVAADLTRGREPAGVKLIDDAELRGVFEGADLRNGLTDGENQELSETSDLDLIVALIMRGLRRLGAPHRSQ